MRKLITIFILTIVSKSLFSQSCPNINFNLANFSYYWQCYTGSYSNGNDTIYPCLPTNGKHSIMDAALLTLRNQIQDENCHIIPKVSVGFAYAA